MMVLVSMMTRVARTGIAYCVVRNIDRHWVVSDGKMEIKY